jgi:hypothetical protein
VKVIDEAGLREWVKGEYDDGNEPLHAISG